MTPKDCSQGQYANIKEHWIIFLVLLLALLNGGIYLFLIPPWQHYDEPGHLEYAWLITDRLSFPQKSEYDQSMRREMAASMVEHNFFKDLDFRPNLLLLNEPIWIGNSQINGSPLYYILIALPLRLIRYSDITFQLYIGRTISLSLFLLTIITAYGIIREITPDKNPLRWMVPFSLAVLPGFVDIMTAVNDDVGATLVFSLFLWAGVRIIQKGLSWQRVTALALTTLACAFTKNTVIIALILATIPVLVRLFRKARRGYWWAGLALLGLLLMPAIFRIGDAAEWHHIINQRVNTRHSRMEAPIGSNAFQFTTSNGIFQIIPHSDLNVIKGKTVTLGAWMWADKHRQAQTPTLKFNGKEINQSVDIGKLPTFHAFSASLPEDLSQLMIKISPGAEPTEGNRIYYDGIILVEGNFTKDGVPSASDIDAAHLEWNKSVIRNYIRNASAERNWLAIRSKVNRILADYIPGGPDLNFSLLQDWRGSGWYYQVTFENLFKTFGGKFGWGHIPLLGKYSYYGLALIFTIGIIGAVMAMTRQWRDLPIDAYLFLFISGAIVWVFAIMRGLTSIIGQLFIPSARYAYPAIIPTMFVVNMGWLEIAYWLQKRISPRLLVISFVVFFIALDALAIASIINYYR